MGKKKKEDPMWFTPVQRLRFREEELARIEQVECQKGLKFKEIPQENRITYFNRPFKSDKQTEYDRFFHFVHGYDQKVHRCDRQNIQLIQNRIFIEEDARIVPLVTSQHYGHLKTDLEGKAIADHKRKNVMKEVLRRWRINVKPSKKLPTEFVVQL